MQKLSTTFFSLLIATLFFSACKENNIDGPATEIDCATLKDWTDNQGTRFLLNEYEFTNEKIAKITSYKLDGKKSETRMEYDSQGRLINIFEKVAAEGTTPETEYLTVFKYHESGQMGRTENYKIVDGHNNLIQERLYDYQDNKLVKIVSSAGVHWRYEYNESGNVNKTFFQPLNANEYLLEEFTGFDDKLLVNTLQNARILQKLSVTASGINLSKNNALAFKVYNPDGSVNVSYNFVREYNTAGNQTKLVTTTTGSSSTTSTIETEYPTCK